MKKEFYNYFKATILGFLLFNFLKRYYDLYRFIRTPNDEEYIRKPFKKHLGYEIDLDNPKTLNEKIQWLKLFDRRDIHTLCADKISVREYIKNKVGSKYLIPLLFETEDVKTIIPEKLPEAPFIIKCNHDSGNVTIVRDKSKFNWFLLRLKLSFALKNNFYYNSREWQYKNIKQCLENELY